MEFSTLNDQMIAVARSYCKEYGIDVTRSYVALKLHEEVGEFAQAFMIHERMSRSEKFVEEHITKDLVAQELADIVGMTLFMAHVLDIDMEKALKEKWLDR